MTAPANPNDRREAASRTVRALPGYPWLPCKICGFTGSCDHTAFERARAAGLNFHPALEGKPS